MKNLSFQRLLFIAFSTFLLLTFTIIMIMQYRYHKEKENVNEYILSLHILNKTMMADNLSVNQFILHDLTNQWFHKLNKSVYLEIHNDYQDNIYEKIRDLKTKKVYNHYQYNISTDTLWTVYMQYDSTISNFVEYAIQRGFKEFGTEGTMRKYAHKLEQMKFVNQTQLLQLRRNEKDYIIRHDTSYKSKFNENFKILYAQINESQDPYVDSAKTFLLNYKQYFHQLIDLDLFLGIHYNSGLYGKLISQSESLSMQMEEMIKKAEQKKEAYFRNLFISLTWQLIIFGLISLFASIFSSKYLIKPIQEFLSYMDDYGKGKFHKPQIINYSKYPKELQQLFIDLNHLIEIINERESMRIKAEVKVIESNIKTKEFTDMLPVSVFECDKNLTITYANCYFCNTFGYENTEIKTNKLSLKNLFITDNIEALLQKAINKKHFKALCKNETVIDAELYINKLTENNAFDGYRGVVIDTTHRKIFFDELKKQKNKAIEADQLKTAYLAHATHDMRTPLNVIIGFTQILSENPSLTIAERKRYLNYINNCSNQLSYLINDLLDIAKIEEGKLEINAILLNINQFANDLFFSFNRHPKIVDNENLNLHIYNDLSDDVQIFTDEIRLHQIFNNLIENAIKYTKEGEISIGYQLDNGFITFFVKDSGIGIPEEFLPHLFNRFQRANEEINNRLPGSGLGLYVCKNLVEKMGGKIWVESDYGKGTQFYFKLPLESNQTASKLTNLKPSVLIYDSNDNIFHKFPKEKHLKQIEITKCVSESECIELLMKQSITVFFYYCDSITIDTLSIITHINDHHSEVFVFIITEKENYQISEQYLNNGCTQIFSKQDFLNFNSDKILALIQEIKNRSFVNYNTNEIQLFN